MDDYGKPGTAKHHRMWALRGMSQKDFGKLCRPKMEQGAVSQFENAEHRMTWQLAARIAPAAFTKLNERNPHHAQLSVWRLWFTSVDAYGSDVMKRFAREIRPSVEKDIRTIEDETPLLAQVQIEPPVLAQPILRVDPPEAIGIREQMRRVAGGVSPETAGLA